MGIRPLILACLFASLSTGANAAEVKVSPTYLEGKWVLGEKQECGSSNADYVILHKDGIVEIRRGEIPQIVGFWELNNDSIILNMLVSPKASGGENPFYRDSYHYQHRLAKVVETKPDAFGVIVGTDIEAGIQTLSRCS